ncbi:MAG TPA: DUF3362 domain-containing protein, partial [Candidatus Edwardsbacteria bacterium]|nr:DUF3362 domain-containing protein [Candidatus Edwardsbacteria bacterium]
VSKDAFNSAFVTASNEANPFTGRALLQRHGDRAVLCNPPALPLDSEQLDAVYELPYQRAPHPSYRPSVPALETVKWSLVSHRGCYGGCSFCTLYFHQGPVIQSRSVGSVIREVTTLAARKDFRGVISDIGGPTANMFGTNCRDGRRTGDCRRRSCLAPRRCEHLNADQSPSLRLWREVLRVPGVRQVFVASGVRHDLALRDQRYLRELIANRTGGHLKVAPEHCSPRVLQAMNKPAIGDFVAFLELFRALSDKEQYLVPYLISSHPGCGYDDMLELQAFLKQHRITVEQVQDFIPLPMTASAAMYHTGRDPFSGAKLYVERSADGKQRQRALLSRDAREAWETQEGRASAGKQRTANTAHGRPVGRPARAPRPHRAGRGGD